jgi:Family of unknown function (DUF5719)
MRRLQLVVALAITVLAVVGAAYADGEIGPKALGGGAAPERAASGAWYCPHGGGDADWEASLEIANPGPDAATVRIRTMSADKPSPPQTQTVEPGSMLVVPVDASSRERASMVEWFGQWVAVGWVTHASGDAGGVAAEPCSPAAGERWLLPDGATPSKAEDDYVVVMNPSARDAVVSFTLLSDRKAPVQTSALTDVVIKPYHSMVVRVRDVILGEDTVSTLVDAAAGRVVAASLGISSTGGIRSTLGYLDRQPPEVVFPGGPDAGRTSLAVMSTGSARVDLTADLLGREAVQPFPGVADAAPPASSARTFTTTTAEPTSVVFASQDDGVAAVRRTFGSVSDQGATIGGTPAPAWIVVPAISGSPSHPGLALANAGDDPAEVTLSVIGSPGEDTTVTVPPHASVLAPKSFVELDPEAAVLATASSGAFVPAAVSYSRGREGFATYAVALGIAVPDGWVRS